MSQFLTTMGTTKKKKIVLLMSVLSAKVKDYLMLNYEM